MMSITFRKLKKLLNNPAVYLRDYLMMRHPLVLNEVACPLSAEQVLIRHQIALHAPIENRLTIDVVYTWVDDADLYWQQRFRDAQANHSQESVGRYALDAARFANHDELKFSLKSIRRFMPWVNRIYLVTDRQRPAWLTDDADIQIVDHSEIIEAEYLPTFNSHVIEACLHRIPGLSEHFIYFNDDVFAARSLPKNHFFRGNGIASIFVSRKSLRTMCDKGVATPTLSASLQGAHLLKEQYGVTVDTPLVHTYIPLRKQMYELVWSRYRAEIHRFMRNRFRGTEDLNLPTFLVPWTGYFEGLAAPSTDICYYFNVRSPAARTYWRQLAAQKDHAAPHSFCANDFNSERVPNAKEALASALDGYFSEKNNE